MFGNGTEVYMDKYRKYDYSTFDLRMAENIACKTIRIWGKSKLKCDRDNVDFVMNYVIRGFTRFDPNRGTQLRSYLIYNAKRAVQNLVNIKRKKKFKILSLDTNVAKTENFARKHTLSTKELPLYERVLASEIFDYIEHSSWFNERQKIILTEHFKENRSIEEISLELGIHRSYSFLLLRDGIAKLKQKFNNDN